MSELALAAKGLRASVENREILKGLDLAIPAGEIHVVMGPNGSGKSTLAYTLMGNPRYSVVGGEVRFFGEDLLAMKVHERARKGLFLAFQYPVEIPGVSMERLLWSAHDFIERPGDPNPPPSVKPGSPALVAAFRKDLNASIERMRLPQEFARRSLNVGASGGEKKRLEMVQLKTLRPRLAIIDEIDSGLDIDAVKVVAEGIAEMRGPAFTALIITHHPAILELIKPDRVHLLSAGRVFCSRGMDLARELEKKGYDSILSGRDGPEVERLAGAACEAPPKV